MKNVLIIGAGLSGRGMLGEMFYQAGYDIVFADNNKDLVNKLRVKGSYRVEKTNLKKCTTDETIVTNYDVIDCEKEKEKYVKAIAHHDLICTALKPDAFDDVIDHLIQGIRYRKKDNLKDQYITLGANYVHLYEYFDQRIKEKLSEDLLDYYEKYIHLVMSIVNRKNLLPFDNLKNYDELSIIGDDKPVLRVEKAAIQTLQEIPLFFKLEDNLSQAMAVKIWSGNVVQCSLAFVARTKGIEDSRTASYNRECSSFAYQAAMEAYYGVYSEFNLPLNNIQQKAKEAVTIFRNPSFSDDLSRITREPIRKIAYNDRFIGPARMCIKHGKIPYFIIKCMTYCFLIHDESEPEFEKLRIQINNYGLHNTIIKCCGLNPSDEQENILLELIENTYNELTLNSFEV